MSLKVMDRVWEKSWSSSSHLLALLALADWSDDEGLSWYKVQKIAIRARESERQTQRIIKALEDNGQLYREVGHGRGNSSVYFVTVGLNKEQIGSVLNSRFDIPLLEALKIGDELLARQKVSSTTPIPKEKVSRKPSIKKVTSSAPNEIKGDIQGQEKVTFFDGLTGARANDPSLDPSLNTLPKPADAVLVEAISKEDIPSSDQIPITNPSQQLLIAKARIGTSQPSEPPSLETSASKEESDSPSPKVALKGSSSAIPAPAPAATPLHQIPVANKVMLYRVLGNNTYKGPYPPTGNEVTKVGGQFEQGETLPTDATILPPDPTPFEMVTILVDKIRPNGKLPAGKNKSSFTAFTKRLLQDGVTRNDMACFGELIYAWLCGLPVKTNAVIQWEVAEITALVGRAQTLCEDGITSDNVTQFVKAKYAEIDERGNSFWKGKLVKFDYVADNIGVWKAEELRKKGIEIGVSRCKKCKGDGKLETIRDGNGQPVTPVCDECNGTGRVKEKKS